MYDRKYASNVCQGQGSYVLSHGSVFPWVICSAQKLSVCMLTRVAQIMIAARGDL